MSNNKDILFVLQSRIALRANFLAEYAPNGVLDWPAVEDQKADKKAIAEIVKLRRELKKQSVGYVIRQPDGDSPNLFMF